MNATEICNVGTAENVHEYIILDEYGQDVTSNYKISSESGTLSVTPRHIDVYTVTREQEEGWIYDGHWHYDTRCYQSGLMSGYDILPNDDYAKIRNVGEIENKFTVWIYKYDNGNYTPSPMENYIITYHYGTLKVAPRPITVTTPDGYWIFDGEEHYSDIPYYISSSIGLADWESIDMDLKRTSIRDAGQKKNLMPDFKIVSEWNEGLTPEEK